MIDSRSACIIFDLARTVLDSENWEYVIAEFKILRVLFLKFEQICGIISLGFATVI